MPWPGTSRHAAQWPHAYARMPHESLYPALWDGLRALWVPSLGQQGPGVFDISTFDNPGTLTGTPAPVWSQTDRGPGLFFDVAGSHITTKHVQQAVANQQQYTLLVWFKTTLGTSTATMFYFEANMSGIPGFVRLARTTVNSTVTLIHRDDASVAVTINSTTTGYNDGLWHRAVATRNGTDFVLYVDGIVQGTGTATLGVSTIDNITLGARRFAGAPDLFFSGFLDAITVYHRVLTPEEILADVEGASPLTLPLRRATPWHVTRIAATPAGAIFDLPQGAAHIGVPLTGRPAQAAWLTPAAALTVPRGGERQVGLLTEALLRIAAGLPLTDEQRALLPPDYANEVVR